MAEARALAPGSRIGRYEILAELGSGGMGAVYRARDPRVGREVALKVIRTDRGADPSQLRRFELEARAAGSLNHPNVLVLHDVGVDDGVPYLVTELLAGQTLRARLGAGPLPAPAAVGIAVQIAAGLGAAHEKGIVHRDLKPENVFLLKDGRAKILDFGIAKLQPDAESEGVADTLLTGEGAIIGTLGYLSPEQVRGQPADARSDLFALGVLCYEMLAGQRPFVGDSATDIAAAIARDDPPALPARVPPALARIVLRCLEKDPARRYHSARDLAFQLEAPADRAAPAAPRRRVWPMATVAAAAAALLAAGATWLTRPRAAPQPTFQRLSFRRGTVLGARFAHDGRSIVYSAAWNGAPPQVFSTLPGSLESRPLGQPGAGLLALSSADDMALALGYAFQRTDESWHGALAVAPLGGGEPRVGVPDVIAADYAPDGELVLLRPAPGRRRVEWPAGHLVYETSDIVIMLRVAPRGDAVALVTAQLGVLGGFVVRVLDRAGHDRVLGGGWRDLRSIAWLPSGDEIWLAGSKTDEPAAIHAVTLAGAERVVLRLPGDFVVDDIAADGRVLLTRITELRGIRASGADGVERDVSWFDGSDLTDLSEDGRVVVFGAGGARNLGNSVGYVRPLDGSPARPIGECAIGHVAPDGGRLVVLAAERPPKLAIVPLGPGETVPVATGPLTSVLEAFWLPDGRSLVVQGVEPGHESRLYVLDLAGGDPRPFSPEPTQLFPVTGPISPDGTLVLAHAGSRYAIYPLDGGAPRPIAGLGDDEVPIRFTADGRSLYVQRRDAMRAAIVTLELATGARTPWKIIAEPDPTGSIHEPWVFLTADGKAYAYHDHHWLGELFLVTGLR
jgi:dipeptidyl aminopeptidase/acylaminoacyl peptidase